MYRSPGDFLTTYDPTYYEEHDDSSDFEETDVPVVASKKGDHSLLNIQSILQPGQMKKLNQQNTYIDYDQYPVKLKSGGSNIQLDSISKEVQVSLKPKKDKTKDLNRGDQVSTHKLQSKTSLLKHKLIPCISSFFKRGHKEQMTAISENPESNQHHQSCKQNCCQFCVRCEKRRQKKLCKQQNLPVQPVYTMGGIHNLATPFEKANKTNTEKASSPIQYSPYTVSTSSDSNSCLTRERAKKTKQLRNKFKTELLKERLKYEESQKCKNRHLQFPSKDHKSHYQVFSTPFHKSRESLSSDMDLQFLNGIQSSTSGFWDYLFDKFNRKYITHRIEINPKSCNCNSNQACTSTNCKYGKPSSKQTSSQHSGCCRQCPPPPPPPLGSSKPCRCHELCKQPPCSRPSGISLSKLGSKEKVKKEEKVECKCFDTKSKNKKGKREEIICQPPPMMQKSCGPPCSGMRSGGSGSVKQAPPATPPPAPTTTSSPSTPSTPSSSTAPSGPSAPPVAKPCQEAHDQLTSNLAEKYKGEILCIHNPPCILINGCLNLPPHKETAKMNFWPVEEAKKTIYGKKQRDITVNREQGCQYHEPYIDVLRCTLPRFKSENVQSICNHDPPCEVVRGCYKPPYDPKLQNSCIHVPMCDKIPKCVKGEKNVDCDHSPKCLEVPMCSKNRYTVLTARDTVATQVKAKTRLVCRHVPPCIMIPKCLGRAMCDSFMPHGAVPDCVHQPCCELIPACCRKATKEMVTVSTQYPNSCRIV